MARYVVKCKSSGPAGWIAARLIMESMAASGMLGMAKFFPEIGAGAWVELERSAEEIEEVVAEEFALGEYLVAIAAAKKSSALALKGASMFPGIVPCECF